MRLLLLSLTIVACTPAAPDNTDLPAHQSRDGASNQRSPVDYDGDGFSALTGDCNDDPADPSAVNINPGEAEICDGIDNDCDGYVDDADNSVVENTWAPDRDGDGYHGDTGVVLACDVHSFDDFVAATGGNSDELDDWSQVGSDDYVDTDGDGEADTVNWDCDDSDATVYPGAPDICDGLTNDCDSAATPDADAPTSTFTEDLDGDGYGGVDGATQESCGTPEGYADNNEDCDDEDGAINPGATEVCDGQDNNCDGTMDEGVLTTLFRDADGDAYGDATSMTGACAAFDGWVEDDSDCDDSASDINPGAAETCANDGTDNNCDGDASDVPVDQQTWYPDVDGDAFGDSADPGSMSCEMPVASFDFVTNTGDCDDARATVNPDAFETHNGMDDNCDGAIDEGATCVTEIYVLSGSGQATTITGTVNDDVSLSGDWRGGVSGVAEVVYSLGGSAYEYRYTLGVCVTTSLIVDGEFEDGTSLGDGASANLLSYMDGASMTRSLYANGDGTNAYEVTP